MIDRVGLAPVAEVLKSLELAVDVRAHHQGPLPPFPFHLFELKLTNDAEIILFNYRSHSRL